MKRLGIAALAGLLAVVVAVLGAPELKGMYAGLAFIGGVLIVPVLVYTVALCIWHWKARYQGPHSNLWGVLLVVETSGWLKIVYLFRHILPDARGSGRYGEDVLPQSISAA